MYIPLWLNLLYIIRYTFSHLIKNFIDDSLKNVIVISEFLKYKQIIYKYVRNGMKILGEFTAKNINIY